MRGRSDGVATASAPEAIPAYELECLPGLEEFVRAEAGEKLGGRLVAMDHARSGRLPVRLRGSARSLIALHSIVAAHLLLRFAVPRPKALLGHQHFTRLVGAAQELLGETPGAFASVRLSAAGADSTVMLRLRDELASALGLDVGDERADLLVSVRRPPDGAPGWEVLLRTTPRPLSARPWRVCNMPGALNATVAYAMVRLAAAAPGDNIVNFACGSGTLLAEGLDYVGGAAALGVDVDSAAIACARRNLMAAGHGHDALLLQADAGATPIPSAWADVLLTDLPFGMLVGSAQENERLYPALLSEAARVAGPGARLAAITAASRAFGEAAANAAKEWLPRRSLQISVPYKSGYLAPTIYLLERRSERARGQHALRRHPRPSGARGGNRLESATYVRSGSVARGR